jgi:hypothetical protein
MNYNQKQTASYQINKLNARILWLPEILPKMTLVSACFKMLVPV